MRFSVAPLPIICALFQPARVVNLMSLNVKTEAFRVISFLAEINDGLTNQIIQWAG
jgi:hypothetical protein